MNYRIALLALACAALPAKAADIPAGQALAERVCAACHGKAGVSVADIIPNLGGQRAAYLTLQLKALKSGARRNGVMNPIAGQLSDSDIANLAAFFQSQPGAGSATVSDFMPNIARTNVAFPANHRATFIKYLEADFPDLRQVRHYYANPVAVQAARDGKPLPAGAVLMTEVYAARTDAQKSAEGVSATGSLLFFSTMARGEGWGRDIPEMLRNGDWNYAAFQPDGAARAGVNHAECLACHRAQDDTSFMFTFKELAAKARGDGRR